MNDLERMRKRNEIIKKELERILGKKIISEQEEKEIKRKKQELISIEINENIKKRLR